MWKEDGATVRRVRITMACIAIILSIIFVSCRAEKQEGGLEVRMSYYSFNPSTLTVRAGDEVTITLTNSEGIWGDPHDWTLMDAGYRAEAPWTDEDQQHVLAQKIVSPGETQTLTFVAPSEPGEYQIVCTRKGEVEHLEAGEQGKLIVTP